MTLVSQKMCVVVYPKVEEDSGMVGVMPDNMEQQQQPIYQPAASKDKDRVES